MRREMQQLSALVRRGAFVSEAPAFPEDRIVARPLLAPSRNLLPQAALILCTGTGWAVLGLPGLVAAPMLAWLLAGRRFAAWSWRWADRRAGLELGAALARFAGTRLPDYEGSAERLGRVTHAAAGIALEAGPVLHLVERGTVARIPLPLLRGWHAEGGALAVETADRSWHIPLADPVRWARLLVDRCAESPVGWAKPNEETPP